MSCFRHDWTLIGNGNEGCSKCGEVRRWRPFYERHYVALVAASIISTLILTYVAGSLYEL